MTEAKRAETRKRRVQTAAASLAEGKIHNCTLSLSIARPGPVAAVYDRRIIWSASEKRLYC